MGGGDKEIFDPVTGEGIGTVLHKGIACGDDLFEGFASGGGGNARNGDLSIRSALSGKVELQIVALQTGFPPDAGNISLKVDPVGFVIKTALFCCENGGFAIGSGSACDLHIVKGFGAFDLPFPGIGGRFFQIDDES